MKWNYLPLLFFPFFLLAQTPFPALPPVFKDDAIPRVDVFLPPDSLALMLVPGSEYHWHASFVFDNGQIKDTVENVGVKIRGNTSVNAAKKSIRVSFNTYEPGRSWHGLEKLNLNGSHNDPTVARAKISWDLLRWMGVPGPRSNHVRLYINGDYFGLYINVEHIDEEFTKLRFGSNDGNLYKCLWPADLTYKGSNPDLYKQEFGGRRAYALTTNEIADNYTDLAHFIDVLNNTPTADLPCELEKVFNVDSYLKAAAFDVLDGNWDGPIYNKNNFYLYHNLATDLFEYIPYDLDNTLGIDWLNVDWVTQNIYAWAPVNEPRPLYKRLLEVPEYKKRYSYYLKTALQTVFDPSSFFPYLDNLKALIAPAAQTDPYRPLDYGFTFSDFEEGWEGPLPWFQTPEGIKSYVTGRQATALQQLTPGDISPVIHHVKHTYLYPSPSIQINASATDDNLTSNLQVCYRWNSQAQTCLDLFDDGQHADGPAGDGAYGNTIDVASQTGRFEYYVQAIDNIGQQSRQPACGWRLIYVGENVVPLVINEFMASNSSVYPDEAGEFEDWVEIYNPGDAPLPLQNFFLTDNEKLPAKWRMPNIWIQPQAYLVFWADSDESQGNLHTNFKLSASGEYVAIYEKNAAGFSLVDGFDFGEQNPDQATGRLPNGTGDFQPVNPTQGTTNQPYTAVEEIGLTSLSLKISPNPASGRVSITLESESESISEVELMNVSGVVLLRKTLNNTGFCEMELDSVLPGVYFLKVRTSGGNVAWRKLVVN
ncbi:MAG: CotH kinase family protein [Saprospiraceae bacterium]|nr:CotH kinase family protein [Saprospiraceae bacterium]MCF8249456.1 CotH kinase family protein [Saprospiraceae bacterium]MCF8279110.1 CotH kinase family protein [Bacteroidales bacterium]MCF8311585.1 CotH kinase family protein [Saprospiraceae bacterium]MCF8440075.1 CotH kinase family protein [Saprospiraceae bacterium]